MWDRLGTDHKLVIAYGLFSFTSNKLLGANYFFIVFFRASSQLTLPRPSPLAPRPSPLAPRPAWYCHKNAQKSQRQSRETQSTFSKNHWMASLQQISPGILNPLGRGASNKRTASASGYCDFASTRLRTSRSNVSGSLASAQDWMSQIFPMASTAWKSTSFPATVRK